MNDRYAVQAQARCRTDFDWLEEARFWRNFAWLRAYGVSTRARTAAQIPQQRRPHPAETALFDRPDLHRYRRVGGNT